MNVNTHTDSAGGRSFISLVNLGEYEATSGTGNFFRFLVCVCVCSERFSSELFPPEPVR